MEAEALGYHGTFIVEHHFSGFVGAEYVLLNSAAAARRCAASRAS